MTVDWTKAPLLERPAKAPKDAEIPPEFGEEAPQRQRKERSDKGVPRGPRGEGAPRRTRAGASLKEPIGGLLVMVNLPVSMFSPTDALDGAEIEALAQALDEQQKLSPRFRKYLQRLLGAASGGQLLAVAGMVAARRAARHGMLGEAGEQVDMALGQQLSAMTNEAANTPQYVQREKQPTPQSGIGVAHNDAGIPPAGAPTGWTPPVG